MKTPLQEIKILSIYKINNIQVLLPKRMAICTPDTFANIFALEKDLIKKGGKLILSDLFRSYDMQFQAHNDFVSGQKKAFSPPPGGSLHEAGRAMDIDLGSIKVKLKDFWDIAASNGFVPVINKPVSGASESWHFECRGSHQIVYDYYKSGKGTNFSKPYQAMAASAILAIDVHVDKYGKNQKQAQLQSGLVRLGQTLGNIDGNIGSNTQKAVQNLGILFRPNDVESMLLDVENMLQVRFPLEYRLNPV